MKNFIAKADTIDVTLAAIITSGAPVVFGAMVLVATKDGAIGDVVACKSEGIVELASTGAITAGAIVYWDDTAKVVTTSAASGANNKIGYAASAAASNLVKVILRS